MNKITIKHFQRFVLHFYRMYGRHDLPWRTTRDPYKIFVSEMMMQQTQVSRGIERFPRFIRRFPTVSKLARSAQSSVLKEWLGLGYNRRALNLHRAAKMVVQRCNGVFPSDPKELIHLPGVGPYTANAIAAFAFNKPVVVLDTNIRRVFLFHFFRGRAGIGSVSDSEIIPLIQETLYRKNPRRWYSALMDYGALGDFGENPNRFSRRYALQSRFEGSRRFVRARIVSFLLKHVHGATKRSLESYVRSQSCVKPHDLTSILLELSREGFIAREQGLWRILR